MHGLGRIWFDLGATQQYYPVLHSAFWLEHRLWGDAAGGYHVVNLLLHAAAAFLFACVLRRLEVPGARLAAAIFALHPVGVESVAWISRTEEQRCRPCSTFLAALAYLRLRPATRFGMYFLATALFVLALLTKSVTATLPAALAVVVWWQRGRLSWRDLAPLLPWFALGAAAGGFTSWVERRYVGAEGVAAYSVERTAARVGGGAGRFGFISAAWRGRPI